MVTPSVQGRGITLGQSTHEAVYFCSANLALTGTLLFGVAGYGFAFFWYRSSFLWLCISACQFVRVSRWLCLGNQLWSVGAVALWFGLGLPGTHSWHGQTASQRPALPGSTSPLQDISSGSRSKTALLLLLGCIS